MVFVENKPFQQLKNCIFTVLVTIRRAAVVGLIVALCLLNQRGQQSEEKFHENSAEPEVSRLPCKEFDRRNPIPGISRDFLRSLLVDSRCVCNRR